MGFLLVLELGLRVSVIHNYKLWLVVMNRELAALLLLKLFGRLGHFVLLFLKSELFVIGLIPKHHRVLLVIGNKAVGVFLGREGGIFRENQAPFAVKTRTFFPQLLDLIFFNYWVLLIFVLAIFSVAVADYID